VPSNVREEAGLNGEDEDRRENGDEILQSRGVISQDDVGSSGVETIVMGGEDP
jgi:hypothetical protein